MREKEDITAETKQKCRRPDLHRQARGTEGPMGREKAAAEVPSWVQGSVARLLMDGTQNRMRSAVRTTVRSVQL